MKNKSYKITAKIKNKINIIYRKEEILKTDKIK